MRESTSTSKAFPALFTAAALAALLAVAPAALAQEDPTSSPSTSATDKAEDDDFQTTPYQEYADFNEAEEEESAIAFFQNGRFFGVSIGGGFHDVIGNRGLIWKGGLPLVSFKLHAWFDLNLGIQIFFNTVSHNYSVEGVTELTDVSIFGIGADFKYYIGTQDVSAPVTFANPYVLVGGGSFSKNEFDHTEDENTADGGFGVDFGFGLEFAITPRKSYFAMEAKGYLVTYADTNNPKFADAGVPDLTGIFYSVTGNIMFTW